LSLIKLNSMEKMFITKWDYDKKNHTFFFYETKRVNP